MGDLYAFYTALMLQSAQPYPGDLRPLDPDKCFDEKRFLMYLVSDTEYIILDHQNGTDLTISVESLHNPDFMPALWYAQARASELGMNPDACLLEERYLDSMDDVQAGAVKILLENNECRAWGEDIASSPLDRFEVCVGKFEIE
ncbi:hypothetical protein B0H17DRAFT_1145402 [Mycena rosella]|uniref:Uncharacterized protein n=1 Tax=Mycena rosella TaxID=1033263 RepID=A0AAD7CRB4_MYCRO|nr:hypothetical protein B0H17DRAFT_1145402 [Mycena rosella]